MTIVYAKFGGQTECIMDNWKIMNSYSTDYFIVFVPGLVTTANVVMDTCLRQKGCFPAAVSANGAPAPKDITDCICC